MVRACPDRRQAERDIHTLIKRVKLKGNQPLIVIHAQNTIEFPGDGLVKNGIGRMRAGEKRIMGFLQFANGGSDDFDLFDPEVTSFAGMGVQPRHGDSRGFVSALPEKGCQQVSNAHDFGFVQKSCDLRQRDMGSHQRNGQSSASEAHRKIFNARARSKKFRLPRKFVSDIVKRLLRDGSGDDGLPSAGSKVFRGGFQRLDRSPGRLLCR